jgi:fructosamine-3-kinase
MKKMHFENAIVCGHCKEKKNDMMADERIVHGAWLCGDCMARATNPNAVRPECLGCDFEFVNCSDCLADEPVPMPEDFYETK